MAYGSVNVPGVSVDEEKIIAAQTTANNAASAASAAASTAANAYTKANSAYNAANNAANLAAKVNSAIYAEELAMGHQANASGDSATAIGDQATAPGYCSTALGFRASASDGNSVALGSGANAHGTMAVAIGLIAQTNSNNAVALGYSSYATGNSCVALGYQAKAQGVVSTGVGPLSNSMGNCSTALGWKATVPSSEESIIQLGNASNISALKCKVALTVTSDERDKTDITNVGDGAVDFLRKIKAVRYVWNGRGLYVDDDSLSEEEREKKDRYGLCAYDREAHARGDKKGSRIRVGVLAQQVQKALKEVYGDSSYANLVDDNLFDVGEIPEGVENQLSVNYSGFVPFLIKGIQELDQRLGILEGGQA